MRSGQDYGKSCHTLLCTEYTGNQQSPAGSTQYPQLGRQRLEHPGVLAASGYNVFTGMSTPPALWEPAGKLPLHSSACQSS